jgi:hypothetical protein
MWDLDEQHCLICSWLPFPLQCVSHTEANQLAPTLLVPNEMGQDLVWRLVIMDPLISMCSQLDISIETLLVATLQLNLALELQLEWTEQILECFKECLVSGLENPKILVPTIYHILLPTFSHQREECHPTISTTHPPNPKWKNHSLVYSPCGKDTNCLQAIYAPCKGHYKFKFPTRAC